MTTEKYINWKNEFAQRKKDIEAEIISTFNEGKFKNFVKLINPVSVSLKNGLPVNVTMLENKGTSMIYYSGPMPYLLEDLMLESLNDIYFSLIQSINNPKVVEKEIF